jgi:hypothetical protein
MTNFRSVMTMVRYVTEEPRSMIMTFWRFLCSSGLTRCSTCWNMSQYSIVSGDLMAGIIPDLLLKNKTLF